MPQGMKIKRSQIFFSIPNEIWRAAFFFRKIPIYPTLTNMTPSRSPWATLNKPTLFSLDGNIVSHMNNSLDPIVLLWVERTHVLQTNVGSVRSEEQRVQLDCKKIYGKVETVRLWRSVVGKLLLLWVKFNAIEAVYRCESSNFGVSWCCCGRSVVKSVQEELTSEPFWDLFIKKESIRRSLVDIFARAPAQTLLLTLFGLVSGYFETDILSHHRETCFFWSSVSSLSQRRQLDHEMYVSMWLDGGCGDQNSRWNVCWCWLNQKIE